MVCTKEIKLLLKSLMMIDDSIEISHDIVPLHESDHEWKMYDVKQVIDLKSSNVYIQLRDDLKHFETIESEFPLFFNLVKQHFQSSQSIDTYEKVTF